MHGGPVQFRSVRATPCYNGFDARLANRPSLVFTARRYILAQYMLSSCVHVRLSHAGVVSERLNVESRKQRHTIDQEL